MTKIGGKIANNFAEKGWNFSKSSDISPIKNSNIQTFKCSNVPTSDSQPLYPHSSMHL